MKRRSILVPLGIVVMAATLFGSPIWAELQTMKKGAAGASVSLLGELPALPKVALNSLPQYVRQLATGAKSASAANRMELCASLAEHGESGVKGLVYLLADKDANLRWEAVSALGDAPTDTARTAVRAMLADSQWAVRSEAARTLGRIGKPDDGNLLRELATKDSSAAVKTAALRGLESLRNRAKTGKAEPKRETPMFERPPAEGIETPVSVDAAEISAAPVDAKPDVEPLAPESEATDPETTADIPTLSAPMSERGATAAVATTTIQKPGEGMKETAAPTPSKPRGMNRPPRPAEDIPLNYSSTPNSNVLSRPRVTFTEADVRATAKTVDEFVYDKIRKIGLEASSGVSDPEFLRRVYLDLTGVIPPTDLAAEFAVTGTTEKRRKVIDRLLTSEEYQEHWTNLWSAWLVGSGAENGEDGMAFRAWLRKSITENTPYDFMVRQMLTSPLPTNEDGAGVFLLRYDTDPVELAARTSRLFLGLPMQCAQCHDHKSESWKQKDFFGVAAFFAATRREAVYRDVTVNNMKQRQYVGTILMDKVEGDVQVSIPEKNESMGPKFLTGETVKPVPGKSLRETYANWVTNPKNPYFAKAIVNRIWAQFMGRGFVEPVDGFGENVLPTHPELLDWLAQDFVAHGYDLRYLTKVLLNTEAYQRSAKATEKNKNDELYLTRARIRPLTAEQLFYSLLQATNIESAQKIRRQDFEGMKRQYLEQYRYLFGNDEQEEETPSKATIAQALMMLNGPVVHEGSRNVTGSRLARILSTENVREKRLDAIYLTTLSRLPTPAERSYFRFYYDGSSYRNKNNVFEDIFWGLLNSAEFASNH